MGRNSADEVLANVARQKERQKTQESWSPLRKRLFRVVTSFKFEAIINSVLLLNILVLVAETNASGQSDKPLWIRAMNMIFLTVYFFEIAARILVEGRYFFNSSINVLDFTLVSVDLMLQVLVLTLSAAVPSISVLRLVKVLRLLRALRALSAFRELWMMLHGLLAALKAMVWACLLVGIVLLIWSILSVELLNGLAKDLHEMQQLGSTCDHCPHAFESVQASMLTWFIVVFTGDMWMDLVVPILKYQPWTVLLIFPSFFIIHFGMLNLILTVIVDRASEARAEDHQMTISQKKQDLDSATEKLSGLCEAMDSDKSGCLTLEELTQGFEDFDEFKHALLAMDVQKEDLDTVFSILDLDKSGTVAYDEFVKQLHKMKTEESHTVLIFIKHHMQMVLERVEKQVTLLGTWMETNSHRQDAEIREMRRTLNQRLSYHPGINCAEGTSLRARSTESDTEHDSGSESFSQEREEKSPKSISISRIRRSTMV